MSWEIIALSSIIDKARLIYEYNDRIIKLEEELQELVDDENVFYNYKYMRYWHYHTDFGVNKSIKEYLKEMTEYKDSRIEAYGPKLDWEDK